MLKTLQLYQDRVEALASEAEQLLRRDGRSAVPRVVKLRTDQGLAMAAYQLFIHRELFEPLIKSGSPAQIEAAKRLKVECVVFAGTFCRYVQDWSKRDAVAEWDRYRPAALGMLDAVRTHIRHVREELAPAIERLDRPDYSVACATR